MKKVGIITIKDDNNYGNRLQNYAMQQILINNNFSPSNIIKGYKGTFKHGLIIQLKKFIRTNQRKFHVHAAERKANFKIFNKNISDSKFKLNNHTDYKNLDDEFDYFVIGSDQIWNNSLFKDDFSVSFATFAKNEKRVAVSPSISKEFLNETETKIYSKYLAGFDKLSCREEEGSKLIRSITGKECVTLIDPTLMLSESEWNKVVKKPKFHDDSTKFLLLYFLGGFTEDQKEYISKIKIENNLTVIDIYDKKSIYYGCGPSEFLYLIKNCSIIFTDSFHGSVFSVIFKRPFYICKRQGKLNYMFSRLSNLVKVLHLENREFDTSNNKPFEVDYTNSDKYLEIEKQKVNSFIKKNMN